MFAARCYSSYTLYLAMPRPTWFHISSRASPRTRVLDGMPDPEALPGGLTEADLDYNARAFARTGFRGALNRYRNMDRDWEELARLADARVEQPALFMGGERDSTVLFGSVEPMKASLPNLRKVVLLPGCGHWTQQERPAEVNAELIDFLRRESRC
jgi:pimeloyl-ACP methyl ester carboxylesterase